MNRIPSQIPAVVNSIIYTNMPSYNMSCIYNMYSYCIDVYSKRDGFQFVYIYIYIYILQRYHIISVEDFGCRSDDGAVKPSGSRRA